MKIDLSKKYGFLLVDFVNAESTEDSTLSFWRNLQRCFSVSLDFYEKMKRRFPSISPIATAGGEDEKRLLDLILNINGIVDQLNYQFKLINYGIENYDPRTRTINLMSLEWNRDTVKGGKSGSAVTDGGGFLQTLTLLGLSIVDGPVTIKIDAIRSEIENLLGPVAAGQISNLISVAHEIEELIERLGEVKYEKLQQLAEEQGEIFDFHKQLATIRSDCGDTLRMVIDGRSFHDIPALNGFLEIYNNVRPHRLIIGDKNRLIPVFPIDEEDYVAVNGIQGWLDALQKMVAYCLVEFLKSENDRKYLKKCAACHRFFIARQPRTQKFCAAACRLNRHRHPARINS